MVALVALVGNLCWVMLKGNTALLILLDLPAAFGTINHEVFLNCLSGQFGRCHFVVVLVLLGV